MIGARFLPKGLQSKVASSQSSKRGWIGRNVSRWLESVSCAASKHPIHTIVIVAVLASSTYVSLLEGRLFRDSVSINTPTSRTDFESLLTGSKKLLVGEETSWKWQAFDEKSNEPTNNLALITLAFPESLSLGSLQNAVASPVSIPLPHDSSATQLSSSSEFNHAHPQASTLAFSVLLDEAAAFLLATREIPALELKYKYEDPLNEDQEEELKWIMKATKTNGVRSRSFSQWIQENWNTFTDLLKNAESLDIVIMALGYLSMHLTFVSLFLSMRRLGSNFWLATSVLLSSVFAFLFGLHVTMRFGVPINMVLLSEGLPFLVVTIGFEKPIILTKSVLSASLDARKIGVSNGEFAPSIMHQALQIAINESGASIIRDYCLEILILVAGAASGIQGGLRQFCFLAAWTLFFDCILLFTFYMSILTIKLEINRIKRHVTMRKALIEDGVSRRVAETVASSNEWPNPKDGKAAFSGESALFGPTIRDSSVPKFKAIMVSGFILINILNLCKLPFSNWSRVDKSFSTSSVSPTFAFDPFLVAGNGLNEILAEARLTRVETAVTVIAPIKYELYSPSLQQYLSEDAREPFFDFDYPDQMLNGVGGKVVEGVLKSFEDPVLSKWMIAALIMSLVLNGYLFNAARWSIKDPSEDSSVPASDRFVPASRAMPAPEVTLIEDNTLDDEGVSDERFSELKTMEVGSRTKRAPEECEAILRQKKAFILENEELTELSLRGKLPGYALEKSLGDMTRAVRVRRAVIARTPATRSLSMSLETSKLPYKNFNYERVHGACCENVIGYVPLPVGVAGPLMVDGQNYFIPMATTEGVLVASTSRGAKAINAGGGATTCLIGDGMTRGPCIAFPTLSRAGAAKLWLDSDEGYNAMKTAFDSTSRFARLKSLKTSMAGTYLYVRFKTTTGDAMGMNMISKGVEHALHVMSNVEGFDDMSTISVSGNFCTDKKPAAVNWIDGRGKSVVAEAVIPEHVIKNVLKSDVDALVELNTSKNLIGSAMAGSVGGFNAHAANVVTAIFLATGQDAAQNVESSNCITVMKNLNGNLQISVSMPSIEVGTIGGGTILEPQAAMLDLLGVRGAHQTNPGDNARRLACIVAATVLAGELSLCSALAAGHLVKAHMQHNRSAVPSRAGTPTPSSASANASMMTSGSAQHTARPGAAGLTMTSGSGGKSGERT